jgi:L-alanine-DL-glutamate epimerase-like enolase superfamily enzyme
MIREEICAVPFAQEGGFIAVPEGAGLGIEVDEEVVERLRI